jgi:hypothetical protein
MPKVIAFVVVVRVGVGTGVFAGGTAGFVVTSTFGAGAVPTGVPLATPEQPTRAAVSADATSTTATRPTIFER